MCAFASIESLVSNSRQVNVQNVEIVMGITLVMQWYWDTILLYLFLE